MWDRPGIPRERREAHPLAHRRLRLPCRVQYTETVVKYRTGPGIRRPRHGTRPDGRPHPVCGAVRNVHVVCMVGHPPVTPPDTAGAI